ncbi:hypothetical protein D3C81_1902360 [compost metagenome]
MFAGDEDVFHARRQHISPGQPVFQCRQLVAAAPVLVDAQVACRLEQQRPGIDDRGVEGMGIDLGEARLGDIGGVIRVAQSAAEVATQVAVMGQQVVDDLRQGCGGGCPGRGKRSH